jgi:hypothetical protein
MVTGLPLRITLIVFFTFDTPTPFSNHHALVEELFRRLVRGSCLELIACSNHRRSCLSHRLNEGITLNVLWSKKPTKKTRNVVGCYSQPVLAHFPRLLISSRSNHLQSVHVLWVAGPVIRLALTLEGDTSQLSSWADAWVNVFYRPSIDEKPQGLLLTCDLEGVFTKSCFNALNDKTINILSYVSLTL